MWPRPGVPFRQRWGTTLYHDCCQGGYRDAEMGKDSDWIRGQRSAQKVKTQNLLLVRIQGCELEPQYEAPLIGSDSANGAAKVQFGP